MEKIKEAVLIIVKELTQTTDIGIQQGLLDEGILDSLTTIELISKLEEHFGINIDSDDLNHQNFNTVENVALLVQKSGYSGSV